MSQHDQHSDKDFTTTRLGMGRKFLRVSGVTGPVGDGAPPGARLGTRLGRGGQVFAAERPGHGGRMAAKLLPWAVGLPAQVVQDFTREALTVANLHHPHVAQALDAGTCRDGTPFLILERMAGRTLEEHLAAHGALPLGELLDVVRGVASALSAAHAVGVVHRELRADNVFLVDLAGYRCGFPRLLDFGLARLTAGAREAGRVVPDRSPTAVAPEQRRDGIAAGDARADQFALAALAYRLLTGAHPPSGPAGGPAFERLWDGGAAPPAARADEILLVEVVLQRAMSWRPEARFDSVASFFRALEQAARASARPAPALPHALPLAHAPALPPTDEPPPRRRPPTPAEPSLTQQFFAEGDRQEAAHALVAAADESDGSATDQPPPVRRPRPRRPDASVDRSGAFDHVPRRRVSAIAAAALGLVSLAVIAWSSYRWLSANADGDDTAASPAVEGSSSTSGPGNQ